MSFPVDGAALEITNWLRTKSFAEPTIVNFANWDAEAMLAVTEIDLKADIPPTEGRRLWALINAARSHQGKFVAYFSYCLCMPVDCSV
jgi:SAM domain (Sterile alpha motif)